MALTLAQFAAALQLGDGVTEPVEPLRAVLTRLSGVADATVELLAPDAPVAIKEEATVRYGSYLYDRPNAPSGDRYAAAWRNSGAGSLVAGWVVRRVAETIAAATSSDDGSGDGVDEARIGQLIAAAITAHTSIIAAHHTQGGVVDADAVRQIIVASLSAGNARGDEFARTPTLPTTATTDGIDIDYILATTAPAGTTVLGGTARLPHLRPSSDIIGVWAVALVGSAEADEILIPWGGGGIEEEGNSVSEKAYYGISFVLPGQSGTRYLDVLASHRRGDDWTLSLEGDGDALPADSSVRFYLARAAGVTVQGGTPDDTTDGLDMAAVAELIATHTAMSEAHHVPGMAGGADTVARAAAATAQAAAEAASALAATKDDAFDWATVGDTTPMPADKHRLATTSARGAVAGAGSNAIVDAESDTAVRGWSLGHLFRILSRKVEAWARVGANTLIPPSALFGTNHATNRLVAIATDGSFELIEDDAAESSDAPPIVLFATAAVSGGWTEITLTQAITTGFLIEFRLAGVGSGGGEYALATADAILETSEASSAPSNYTGALPIKTMEAGNTGFGHDTLIVQRSDEANKLWVRTGRSIATSWKVTAYPLSGGGSAVTTGEILAVVAANVSAWAIDGNTSVIPYNKMSFVLPSYILDPINHPDIPYTAMDGTLEPWAVVLDQAARDAGSVPQIIPNERLPVARLLPSPTGLDDGVIPTVASGIWTTAVNPGASDSGGATVSRYDLRFDASTYVAASGNSTLTVDYPAGVTRESARAAMKTGFIYTDSHETPAIPNSPATETSSGALHGEGSALRVDFLDANIRLTLIGATLDDTNQRNSWQCRLTMVS